MAERHPNVSDLCYHCKSCGAAIVWITTPGGKQMPCNATPVYYIQKPKVGRKKIVTKNGEVISCEYTEDPHKATGVGYIPHWSTCDKSDSFRKSKKESEDKKNDIN